ncbi:unnamed protein product [Prorocentrum cordatum]|uniref:Uncharacterized protein n=1 Tax=Prorocentrum cordatum TaxID=2364126 RepID=A0ABN9Y328_9DINO|nr:unnamed protein product [Polarella glacialis]
MDAAASAAVRLRSPTSQSQTSVDPTEHEVHMKQLHGQAVYVLRARIDHGGVSARSPICPQSLTGAFQDAPVRSSLVAFDQPPKRPSKEGAREYAPMVCVPSCFFSTVVWRAMHRFVLDSDHTP